MLAIICTEGPFAAFSPKQLKVIGDIETVAPVTVYSEGEATILTQLNLELFNGSASIDLSNIGRKLFKDSLIEIGNNDICKAFLDYRRYAILELWIPGYSADYTLKYTALNAVSQPGVDDTYTWMNKVLTKSDKILWYPGFTEHSYLAVLTQAGYTPFFYLISSQNISRTIVLDTIYSRVAIVNLDTPTIPTAIAVGSITSSDWTDGIIQGTLPSDSNFQELSGLTAAYKAGNEDYLWVISDSPANMIAAIKKSDASSQGIWSLTGTHSASDWEDVESSVVNGVSYLYIFDFGNNPNAANSRGTGIDMVIHRVVEPTVTGSAGSTANYISINCAFPAAHIPTHRDCEAAIIDPATGDIYIITKRETIPSVYKLAHSATYTGIQTLTYMGKMRDIPDVTTAALGATLCNVVDATINKFGTEIIVKNYGNAYLFSRNPVTQTVYQALCGVPTIITGYVGGGSATPATSHPNAEPQGEGFCFDESGTDLFSVSEFATSSTATRFPLFKYSRVSGVLNSIVLQDGLGYAGTKDTYIWDVNPSITHGTETTFVVDNVDATEVGRPKGLLRFDLEKTGIPSDATIIGARLDLNIAVEGQGFLMYKMLTEWAEDDTYANTGAITNDGIKASIEPDCVNGINLDSYTGAIRNNIPISTIQSWIDNPSTNNGWLFDAADATTGDGVQISSREDAVIANRPKLTIRYKLNYGITPLSSKDVKVMCIPNSPMYVRWMNDVDGVEHWMFSGKKLKTSEITDQEVFTKRVDTNEEFMSNSRLISATRKDLITVGSQSVSIEDAEVLNTLIFSPLIEYYDTTTGTWQKVLIESASVPIDYDDTACVVTFTFKLPTRNIQTY